MNITDLEHEKSRGNNRHWILIQIVLSIMVLALLAWPALASPEEQNK